MKNTNIKRGQIYFCDIPKTAGSVYHSMRPVLIISNNVNNHYSGCVTAIPLTSRNKTTLPTHEHDPQRSGNCGYGGVDL